MQPSTSYKLLTFYHFVDIADPVSEVKDHLNFCNDIGLKGRIYIGTEWISATLSWNNWQIRAYKLYLANHPFFHNIADIDVKACDVKGHCFKKMIVKVREEIVTLGKKYTADQIKKGWQRMTIEEFKNILDKNNDDYVIIDMRNSYEYKLWHFKNALPAWTVNFHELPNVIDRYKKFGGKKIITYCTGGIRCEKATVMLREAWLDNVYQLDGGVIKYVNTFNDGNRLGNLYTFDGIVSKKIGDEKTHTTIGECIYSGMKTDNIENCRYGPCNARIICRKKQYKRHMWFCSYECFTKGKQDLLIKNADFDKLDYQAMRSALKRNPSEQLKQAFVSEVSNHLDSKLAGIHFTHQTSQKEEIVDRCLMP